AYLFVGPPNVGKTAVAMELAKALNCETLEDPADTAAVEPCDECRACRAIEKENYPDFMILRPTTKLEERTSDEDEDPDDVRQKRDIFVEMDDAMIRIDDVRDRLFPHVSLKRSSGRRKVYIICRVETMNSEAANAFLKTLEEPPPNTTFVLTSTNTSELLPTIVSRCQVINFNPVRADETMEFLQRTHPEEAPERLQTLVSMSAGRVGWAQRLLQHPETLDIRSELLDLCAQLAGAQYVDCNWAGERFVEAAERWWMATNDKEMAERALKASRSRVLRVTMRDIIDILVTWLRDLLVVTCSSQTAGLINVDHLQELQTIAVGTKADRYRTACSYLHDLKNDLRGNANLQLVSEILALRLIWAHK
ncbi:MAG: ATP-binding protein, partial [Armatimonadota bacterium]